MNFCLRALGIQFELLTILNEKACFNGLTKHFLAFYTIFYAPYFGIYNINLGYKFYNAYQYIKRKSRVFGFNIYKTND